MPTPHLGQTEGLGADRTMFFTIAITSLTMHPTDAAPSCTSHLLNSVSEHISDGGLLILLCLIPSRSVLRGSISHFTVRFLGR